MAIVAPIEAASSLGLRGWLGRADKLGRMRLGFNWLGSSHGLGGTYQRKRVGVGSTLPPYKRGNRWAISRMRQYRPTNTQQPAQQAWRGVFAAGKAQYDLLTVDDKKLLSKEARGRCMSGYNLFMSRWLQSNRA